MTMLLPRNVDMKCMRTVAVLGVVSVLWLFVEVVNLRILANAVAAGAGGVYLYKLLSDKRSASLDTSPRPARSEATIVPVEKIIQMLRDNDASVTKVHLLRGERCLKLLRYLNGHFTGHISICTPEEHPTSIIDLPEALRANTALKELCFVADVGYGDPDIPDYPLDGPTYQALSTCTVRILGTAKSIEKLEFNSIRLDQVHAQAVGEALKSHTALKSLSLLACGLDDPTVVAAIMDGIRYNSSIEKLALIYDNIIEQGYNEIAKAVCTVTTLKTLDISLRITDAEDDGIVPIIDTLCENSSLEALGINGLWISEECANRIVRTLGINHTLQMIAHEGLQKINGDYLHEEISDDLLDRIELLLSYNRLGPVTARARKTGECPPEWLQRTASPELVPLMVARAQEIGGEESGLSVVFHLVRKYQDIQALIEENCAKLSANEGMIEAESLVKANASLAIGSGKKYQNTAYVPSS